MSLTSSIPVLRVSDYPRARAFWRDVLGFNVINEAGDPVTGFGIYALDRAQVFLTAWDGPEQAYDGWRAYFHTDDLAGIEDRLKSTGTAYDGPRLTDYGLREIDVTDPDGNNICFGQDAG